MNESIQKAAFKGASWLALFKFVSQMFSWVVTILVARLLSPGDYGLMEMATIITGYAAYFNEMGLGAAVVQREKINRRELSSIFWFILCFSGFLSLVCYVGAYFVANLFNEPRLITLIQTISVVFPIGALQIIPGALLRRHLDFKKVGLIDMIGVFVSSSCMIFIAYNKGGVWTLIFGMIILSVTRLIFVYSFTKWRPLFHFNFEEAKSYISFGFTVFMGRSFFYLFEKSDKFFAGRAWTPQMLGYYGFALQLAQIPTEKISVIINHVSFSAFSRLQNEKQKFNEFYLNVVNATSVLVMPVFVGGYLVGEEIIKLLLTEKWYPIIFVFKYLCLTQITTSINAVNSFVHYAQGRPKWSLYFHVSLAILMATSFYFAVQYGLNGIVVPWFTMYLVICTTWTIITLNKIGISLPIYLKNLFNPIMATLIMSACIILSDKALSILSSQYDNILPIFLITKIVVGLLIYLSYFWIFDRHIFYKLNELRKA